MKVRLKKDIVIKAGTIFDCIDGESRTYHNGNYSNIFGLTKNTSGEIIYGVDTGFPNEENEWFEKIEES